MSDELRDAGTMIRRAALGPAAPVVTWKTVSS
jgi:hypothetical protein